MKVSLILILALYFFCLSTQLSAQTGFCFAKEVSLDQVENACKEFILKKDVLTKKYQSNCLEINLSPQRALLFKRLFSQRFSLTKMYEVDHLEKYSARVPASKSEICKIQILEEEKNKSQEYQINLPKGKNRAIERIQLQNRMSYLMLTIGKKGRIGIEDYNVELKCDKNTHTHYDLEIFLVTEMLEFGGCFIFVLILWFPQNKQLFTKD